MSGRRPALSRRPPRELPAVPTRLYRVVQTDGASETVFLGEAETFHACEAGHVVPLVVRSPDGRPHPRRWKVERRELAEPPFAATLVVSPTDEDVDLGGVRLS